MRIAHTSDWHAGRVFKQVDRLPEMEKVLDALADDLAREKVDLLIHSGDVFDTGAPPAAAESLVFRFFKRVGRAGIRTIVIGGNHDSAARLEAWGGLAELVDVTVVPRPAAAERGGLIEFESRAGEQARIAAVPFAAPRWFTTALELAEGQVDPRTGLKIGGDVLAHQNYAQSLAGIVKGLSEGFRADTVNLLTMHTHLVGAAFSGSERTVHLGDEWATTPQAIPNTAHYVALGHIHKPQALPSAPAPAEYAGSPLQLDFGEVGEQKGWVLVDARPKQPARIERVPYRGARALRRVTLTPPELEREAPALRAEDALLWITVPLPGPDPELNGRVRKVLPNAVRVEAQVPEVAAREEVRPAPGAAPREVFAAYCRHEGREPTPALLAEFDRLLHDCQGNEAH